MENGDSPDLLVLLDSRVDKAQEDLLVYVDWMELVDLMVILNLFIMAMLFPINNNCNPPF